MPEPYQLSELERRQGDDLNWVRTAPEVQQHHGQMVAVRNRRVVAVRTDRAALLAEAAALEGCEEYEFVVSIVPRPSLDEIPH